MSDPDYPLQNAIKGLYTGDALSMPVHWFYRPADIWRAFPPAGIQQMEAAPATHPGSIMSLHSQQGGGRSKAGSANEGMVVGSVILKGRSEFWNQTGIHYHHGMPAGENTLNAWCARLMVQWITGRTEYDADDWLDNYIEFMTADPARHPDTYAESYHREFFSNWQQGIAPQKCGGITHDTPSMGALVTVAPLALALLRNGMENKRDPELLLREVQETCCAHVALTHPDEVLLQVVAEYVALLFRLIWTDTNPEDLFLASSRAAGGSGISRKDLSAIKDDAAIVGRRYSLACYITDSWPSVCYLAARYWHTPAKGLLVNSNLGGENAHRGAVLGTLLGAASNSNNTNPEDPPFNELFDQLLHRDELQSEITEWSTGGITRVGPDRRC